MHFITQHLNRFTQHLNRYDSSTCFLSRPARKLENDEFRIAFYNPQSAFVTDNPKHSEKYPQYQWKNRAKAIIEFIQKDHPHILAFCEINDVQLKTFRKFLGDQYHLVGFSSELRESIEKVEEMIEQAKADRAAGKEAKDPYYGEFVGFLIDRKKFDIDSKVCHELPKGKRHGRVLATAMLIDKKTKKKFFVTSSHFDHLSLESRMKSGEKELELIAKKVEEGIPCLSFGDRNWFPDVSGQECYEAYINSGFLSDIRDSEEGHFGPMGTFPGHLDLPEKFAPKSSKDKAGRYVIEAKTLDVGFVSKNIRVINSYTDYVAFNPETGKLLPNENPGYLGKKNFASDHYYLGATVKIV